MWYYYIRWIFSPYEILATDDLKISSYEFRVSKFTNSQNLCSMASGGFVADEERRSVFLSLQGEDRVAGGAEGDGFCERMERGEFHRGMARIRVNGSV
jgi:hypothetical protein